MKKTVLARIPSVTHGQFTLDDGQVVTISTIIPHYNAGGGYNILVGKDESGHFIWGPLHGTLAILRWGMPQFKGTMLCEMEGLLRRSLPDLSQAASGQS